MFESEIKLTSIRFPSSISVVFKRSSPSLVTLNSISDENILISFGSTFLKPLKLVKVLPINFFYMKFLSVESMACEIETVKEV